MWLLLWSLLVRVRVPEWIIITLQAIIKDKTTSNFLILHIFWFKFNARQLAWTLSHLNYFHFIFLQQLKIIDFFKKFSDYKKSNNSTEIFIYNLLLFLTKKARFKCHQTTHKKNPTERRNKSNLKRFLFLIRLSKDHQHTGIRCCSHIQ